MILILDKTLLNYWLTYKLGEIFGVPEYRLKWYKVAYLVRKDQLLQNRITDPTGNSKPKNNITK